MNNGVQDKLMTMIAPSMGNPNMASHIPLIHFNLLDVLIYWIPPSKCKQILQKSISKTANEYHT
jgi:hypothetical protein